MAEDDKLDLTSITSDVVTYGSVMRRMGDGWTKELQARADDLFASIDRRLARLAPPEARMPARETHGGRRARDLLHAVANMVGRVPDSNQQARDRQAAVDGFAADYGRALESERACSEQVTKLQAMVEELEARLVATGPMGGVSAQPSSDAQVDTSARDDLLSAVVRYATDYMASRSARSTDKSSEEAQIKRLFEAERASFMKVESYAADYALHVNQYRELTQLNALLTQQVADLCTDSKARLSEAAPATTAPLLVDTVQLPDGLTLVVVRPGKVS